MSTYEVPNAQYQRFMQEAKYDGSREADSDYLRHHRDWGQNASTGESYPIVCVSRHNAMAFCRWLTESERKAGRLPDGCVYRLPTEAEWEYAARGGGKSRGFEYTGSNTLADVAWYISNSERKTQFVGQKRPNELGLYDMSGNVWEWCYDWHGKDYYGKSPSSDPPGPSTGSGHVLRGGSCGDGPESCRSTSRLRGSPEGASVGIGFRVVVAFPLDSSSDQQSSPGATSESRGGPQVVQKRSVLPPDLVEVPDAQYAPLGGLVPGSREAQDRQRRAVSELGLPLEVKTAATGIAFRLIPAGSFTMGSPSRESGRDDDETQHQVTLTKPFYCGKYEVTQGQWEAVMGSNPSYLKKAGRDAPVENVSWEDCQAFLKKLCQMEGVPQGTYRLLTEAEWEYACRAGTSTGLCNGDLTSTTGHDRNLDEVGWYDENSGSQSHTVGQKKPNGWGLYDMHGNVWEWCGDWYGDYASDSVPDPLGPPSGVQRVDRGGSWGDYAGYCRSANRDYCVRDSSHRLIGLRLARITPSYP
jgi:formylglycine-generating enzyme required for sulfatase activity